MAAAPLPPTWLGGHAIFLQASDDSQLAVVQLTSGQQKSEPMRKGRVKMVGRDSVLKKCMTWLQKGKQRACAQLAHANCGLHLLPSAET